MNKKLIAVAVAGMFAAPAALAQTSVTISGLLKGGFESLSYGNSAKANTGHSGVADDSSRIVFNVVEDLGGGLRAIGQVDVRFTHDAGGALAASGNTHVGLQSKSWGRIFIGRQDLHYFNRESDLTSKASLRADSISILSYVSPAGGGATQAIAGATRTPNVVHYTTPNWGGFTLIAAYSSTGATAAESDIGSGIRDGYAWNLNPNFAAANWQIGYSYWNSKPDAGGNTLATGNQRGDRLYGSYTFPMGLKIGLAWDKSKIKGATSGVEIAKRDAWSLPISYTWGNHSVHFHYDKANNDKSTAADDGAKMWAIAYAYDLSKRTSAALTYAKISNSSGSQYNFFTSTSLGLGTGGTAIAAGEDPKMFGVTLRHAF
jgi:predicted porin